MNIKVMVLIVIVLLIAVMAFQVFAKQTYDPATGKMGYLVKPTAPTTDPTTPQRV